MNRMLYESLTCAVYRPGESTSLGEGKPGWWQVVIPLPEGPEIWHEQCGDLVSLGRTFEEVVWAAARSVIQLGYRGELLICDETHRTTYVALDFSKEELGMMLFYTAIPSDLGIESPDYAELKDTISRTRDEIAAAEEARNVGTHQDPPGRHEPGAMKKAEKEETTVGTLENVYNPDKDRRPSIHFEQTKEDIAKMADFIEAQDGMTTHLAANLIHALHEVCANPGTTYDFVEYARVDKEKDETLMIVRDAENISLQVRITTV